MQPYPNPNYFIQYQQPQYQQMQSPYMDRLQQLQAQQMFPAQISVTNQGIMAKLVDSFDSITANDVPMSGGALFVKSDGSEIERRVWNADGTISKTAYLPHIVDLETQAVKISSEEEKTKFDAFNEVLKDIQEDVRALNEKIDKINKPTRSKKEAAEDE